MKQNNEINENSTRDEVLEAVRKNGLALEYAAESLRNDDEIVSEAVKQNGFALMYASKRLRADKKIVLAAVQKDAWALEYADDSLKADQEIVLAAVKANWKAFKYADMSLKNNKKFVLQVIKEDSRALRFLNNDIFLVNENTIDRDFILDLIGVNDSVLCRVDQSLKKDRGFVLKAVERNCWAIRYADDSLKADKEIVRAAVKKDGRAFKYVDESLKKDPDFVLEVVTQDGRALEYVDESLKNDVLFFWRIWNIQKSGIGDDYRKEYIFFYLLKETFFILFGAGFTTAWCYILSSISITTLNASTLAPLALLVLIAALGATYTLTKVAKHGYGFFKAQAELQMTNNKNVPAL